MLNLWKSYTARLDESLSLNKKCIAEITTMKIHTSLTAMKPIKIFAILVGILWVGFVDVLIFNLWNVANPFFLVSAGIQSILTKLAIGIYLYQYILIQQVDVSQPILTTQETLARLKSSTLWVARLLFLQLPVWTIFYWNESMLTNGHVILYFLQILVTGLFTFLAIWLFLNIKYENRHKKWFLLLFAGKEWSPVIKSMDMLSEIAEFKSGEK